MILKNERLMKNSSFTKQESQQDTADDSKSEWVEQYEHGVYITFTSLPSGKKSIKRMRFR